MATKTRSRKANSNKALVFNPAPRRQLTLNGSRRRRKHVTRRRKRRNPVANLTAAARRRNPRRITRRRRNPASAGGLLVASLMAAVGVTIFDILATRLVPQNTALVRVGVKLGGAYAFQSMGNKIPFLGKYNKEIALVLGVAGCVDLLKMYALPWVAQVGSAIPGVSALLGTPAATSASDGTTSDIYGNRRRYYPTIPAQSRGRVPFYA